MKKCLYCGKDNPDDAVECFECHTGEFKVQTLASSHSTKPSDSGQISDDRAAILFYAVVAWSVSGGFAGGAIVYALGHDPLAGAVLGFFLGVLIAVCLKADFFRSIRRKCSEVLDLGFTRPPEREQKTRSATQTPTNPVQEGKVADSGLETAQTTTKTITPAPVSKPETMPAAIPHGRWHYAVGASRFGPVSGQEIVDKIKSQELNENTKLWTEGLTKWILLKNSAFRDPLPTQPGPPPLEEVDETSGFVHPAPDKITSEKNLAPPSVKSIFSASTGDTARLRKEPMVQINVSGMRKIKIAIVSTFAIVLVVAPLVWWCKSNEKIKNRNECIDNLRIIDGAKQQWALENHKGASDTPTWEDLRPYFWHGQLPVCPDGGIYTIGTIDVKPTCSVPDHISP